MAGHRSSRVAIKAKKIEVRTSDVHGRGVFALQPIREAELVGYYTGRKYAAEEVGSKIWDPSLTYVFGLSDGGLIDANDGGNDTRFINHACEPNCIAYEVEDKSGLAIEIRAMRAVGSGEELLLDYELDVADNDPTQYECRCASPKCRGTMLARD